MSPYFRTVALIGKSDAERIAETLSELYRYLRERGLRVIVENDCLRFIEGITPESGSITEIG
jgi:NAD+ kinase